MGSKKKSEQAPTTEVVEKADALATTVSAGALAVVEEVDEDAGLGVGSSAAELLIPWYNLLQSNSPQVETNMPGARAGLFQNSVTGEFVRQVVIQPCFIDRIFVLWRDREKGGGIVSRHAPDSPEVLDAIQRNGGSEISTKESPLMIGEHNLLDTRYLYFNVLDEQGEEVVGMGILAAAKSKIKPVKAMNSTVKWCKGQPPLFKTRWTLASFLDQQKGGARKQFQNIELKPFGGPALSENLIDKNSGLYAAGKALYLGASKGQVKVNFDAEGQDVTEGEEAAAGGKRDF